MGLHLKVYCQNFEDSVNNGRSGNLIVYYGSADSFVYQFPALSEYLSDRERARAERFTHNSDHNCYVAVHALLRIELSKLMGIKAKSVRIAESENGKPFIPDSDLTFSLSRTKNMFAFVIARDQFLGVDIEQIKPEIDFKNISLNYFSVEEHQSILSFKNVADQKRTFFEIWTRKEALLKALGIGINNDLVKVHVLEGENVLDLLGKQNNFHSFKIHTVRKKEAIISIASSTDFVAEFKNLSFVLQ
jgi:4'-phosphopantetheinyl transferase